MRNNKRGFIISIYDFRVKAQDGSDNDPMALILKPIAKKMDADYKNNGNIKWNFTKFLIDREGKIAARFESTADMKTVKAKIEEVL